ncbi:MAG: Hsp20/alpha crystallin family protein [Eubacteriales bacterium]|nr:Hsp20/alpha crystallin family protein [Eubacteriales bacterium]
MQNKKSNELGLYNPFRELDEFQKRFFGDPYGFFGKNTIIEFRTDIRDDGDAFVLEADLPGFRKEDINVDINNDIMTVRAERHSEHRSEQENETKGKYIRCERSYGSYSRQFDLSGVNAEGITAKYDNGVLTMNLPKKVPTVPESRRIAIE